MSSLYKLKFASSTILSYVASAPPTGKYPITNLYWDPALSKLIGEYDDAGFGSGNIESIPPNGKYAVTNIYYDPATGTLIGDYDDGA